MLSRADAQTAAELDVAEWIGTPAPLAALRGRVVMVEAFQMLCPGCVSHGLPQAQRVQQAFGDVAVIGLHTVFEHHHAMGRAALEVFLSEYRITFPVAIDRHVGQDPIPSTMRAYGLQGTPSTLLIDRAGRLRLTAFGPVADLVLGEALGRLLHESDDERPAPVTAPDTSPAAACDRHSGCES